LTTESAEPPSCYLVAAMGDKYIRVKGGYLKNFSVRTDPIEITNYGSSSHRQFIQSPYITVDLTIQSILNGIIWAETIGKQLRIRDKIVEDCTINELLIAIQAKMAGVE
jgi:hypothetical protein